MSKGFVEHNQHIMEARDVLLHDYATSTTFASSVRCRLSSGFFTQFGGVATGFRSSWDAN
jgi:hypothetical protein